MCNYHIEIFLNELRLKDIDKFLAEGDLLPEACKKTEQIISEVRRIYYPVATEE